MQFQNAVGTLRAPNHAWVRSGDSGENVLSFYLFVTPAVLGEWGFVYTQEQEQGFYPLFVLLVQGQIAEVLPTVCPCSKGLLAGICWKKSQRLCYFPWVEGAVVTNDWWLVH